MAIRREQQGVVTMRSAVAVGIGLVVVASGIAGSPAQAAKTYPNCGALNRVFPHGVSKNAKAAERAVRDGYSRPATSPRAQRVYQANKSDLDRDKDGTACER